MMHPGRRQMSDFLPEASLVARKPSVYFVDVREGLKLSLHHLLLELPGRFCFELRFRSDAQNT